MVEVTYPIRSMRAVPIPRDPDTAEEQTDEQVHEQVEYGNPTSSIHNAEALDWPGLASSEEKKRRFPTKQEKQRSSSMEQHQNLAFPVHATELELTLEEIGMRDERDASHNYRHGPPETNAWQNSQFHDGKAGEAWGNTVHFAHCVLDKGDTLVFIDVPTSHKNSNRLVSCDGVVPASQVFRVHSKNLKALADSKFPALLDNEIYQARVRRRRKPEGRLLEGIKYLLDLTPPREGDDLVFQMMELSLTPGIIDWWNANQLHNIPTAATRGHDDICTCNQGKLQKEDQNAETPDQQESTVQQPEPAGNDPLEDAKVTLPPDPAELCNAKAMGKKQLVKTPEEFQIPDYCPFRHANSIVRLLFMIEGKAINLNSAARVWTMVGISKIFECPSVVRDQVAQWIMLNFRIIEVLPEEALRMGYALKLPQVTQASFRILVNELALDEAGAKFSNLEQAPNTTVFGRRRGDPGDEGSNAIQHAARAFNDRLSGQIATLRNKDILDFWDIPDWQRLRSIQQLLLKENDGTFGDAIASLQRLMDALAYQIPYKVNEILRQDMPGRQAHHEMDRDRATYVSPPNWKMLGGILPLITEKQKLVLPFFYNELSGSITSGWYFCRSAMHPDQNKKSFDKICDETHMALQKLVNAKPARGEKRSWQILFGGNMYDSFGILRPDGESRTVRTPLVNLLKLDKLVKHNLWPVIRTWMRDQDDFVPQLNLTRHMLLTLTQNEMKFLPLWAGGNDDGTGGVFEPFLPPAEMGPNGPGPAYHTGLTVPSAPSSISDSFMDEIRDMKIMGSTTAGSVDVHDSVSTVYRPDKVIAADSSIASESFEDNTSDYDRAKYEVPADHQRIGQALDAAMDTSTDYDFDFEDDASDVTETAHLSDDENESDREMPDRKRRKSSISTSDAESMVMV